MQQATYSTCIKRQDSINLVTSVNRFNIGSWIWITIPGSKTHGLLYFGPENARSQTTRHLSHFQCRI